MDLQPVEHLVTLLQTASDVWVLRYGISLVASLASRDGLRQVVFFA